MTLFIYTNFQLDLSFDLIIKIVFPLDIEFN